MMYMRAHGSSPGPTQRPWLAGMISSALAIAIPVWILLASGAIAMLALNLGVTSLWLTLSLVATAIVAGGIYSRIFGRAVNDRSGGWLFGIAFGFLLWVLGPTILLQWIRQEQLVIGREAVAVFLAHLVWGLMLGILLPHIHRAIARRSIPHDGAATSYARKPNRQPSKSLVGDDVKPIEKPYVRQST